MHPDGHIQYFLQVYLIDLYISLAYVEEMRTILFNSTQKEKKAITEKYKKRIPEPLNRQFPNRLTKAQAIENNSVRKRRIAERFPSGNWYYNVSLKLL